MIEEDEVRAILFPHRPDNDTFNEKSEHNQISIVSVWLIKRKFDKDIYYYVPTILLKKF